MNAARVRRVSIGLALAVLLVGAGCAITPTGDRYPSPRVGSTASFQPYPRWGISGRVVVIDERTIRIEDLTFNGGELRARVQLQRDETVVAVWRDITGQVLDHETMTSTLPAALELDDFNLVTIYSPDLGAPVSGARF